MGVIAIAPHLKQEMSFHVPKCTSFNNFQYPEPECTKDIESHLETLQDFSVFQAGQTFERNFSHLSIITPLRLTLSTGLLWLNTIFTD